MDFFGLHQAITKEQCDALLGKSDDAAKMEYFSSEIENSWDDDHGHIDGAAWDAIHRCVTDHAPGECALDAKAGSPPLNLLILGGKKVLGDETNTVLRLIDSGELKGLAEALGPLDKAWYSEKYNTHCKDAWPEFGDKNLAYTWESFEKLKDYIGRMAKTDRSVLFMVDQSSGMTEE